ncbi:hypothetical protein AGLY_011383 [Aphis glycines]|uniref:Uncharacterized protein n=1 Tax=Aphis glycines TaxID=307491 RepID=A0A6G0TFF3_APHGL|nr:hypothetical protein AGLY_011383 [Aphis glycines]
MRCAINGWTKKWSSDYINTLKGIPVVLYHSTVLIMYTLNTSHQKLEGFTSNFNATLLPFLQYTYFGSSLSVFTSFVSSYSAVSSLAAIFISPSGTIISPCNSNTIGIGSGNCLGVAIKSSPSSRLGSLIMFIVFKSNFSKRTAVDICAGLHNLSIKELHLPATNGSHLIIFISGT